MRHLLVIIGLFCIPYTGFSQSSYWEAVEPVQIQLKSTAPWIQAKKASYFQLNTEALIAETNYTSGLSAQLDLPGKDGSIIPFHLEPNTALDPGLTENYPSIRTYNATALDGSGARGKVEISHKGVRAMIATPGESTVFLDPVFPENEENYFMVYAREDFVTSKSADCLVSEMPGKYTPSDAKSGIAYNTCELKTYRIAIATTGEYAQFHGGSVADALSAIATTLNRVNGIYERDFGVTLTLIPNNDDIVNTNPSTDPFSNGDTFAMINQNQSYVNSVIGSANYDVGHVFGTNSGGLAGLGVTCTDSQKARGVTGSGAPIGDPFDVDYVAHELGHQFGATHTFNNSCNGNRTNATAMEPGSGSTIMAYAGICSPNVQSNSDDHFHGISMTNIGIEIESDNCPVVAPINNIAPHIDSLTNITHIPASTPFALTAYASDEDPGDILTYCWEQLDNEISTQPPVASSLAGPNFRSFSPDISPTRYFPRLSALASGSINTWEVLPSVSRNMTFRVSVRDNVIGAGCTQFQDMTISVTGGAGPFIVLYPSTTGIVWDAFTTETVTWDVSNTDQSPINCQSVDIMLSIDGGLTYPVTLAEGVANDGSHQINVPNLATQDARVMVINSAGGFFDISNFDFEIQGIENGFVVSSDDPDQLSCEGEDVSFPVSIEGVGNFSDVVELTVDGEIGGATISFDDNSLAPGETTNLQVSNTGGATGAFELLVTATSGSLQQTLLLNLTINPIDVETPVLIFPEDEADFIPTDVTLDWEDSGSPDALYRVQIALNPGFTGEVILLENLPESQVAVAGLLSETTYYWRVQKMNPCAQSGFTEPFSFSTHSCFQFISEDVPVTITAFTGVFNSVLQIPYDDVVTDVNLVNITGTHARTGDLIFTLISPEGTEVVLVNQACGSDDDFNFGFDDAAANPVIDCPATTGEMYVPEEMLAAFNGESSLGPWTLQVEDVESGAGGELIAWSIEICVANNGSFTLSSGLPEYAVCQGEAFEIAIESQELFFFDQPITLSASGLPGGVTGSFTPSVIDPGQNSQLELEIGPEVVPGMYSLQVQGVAGDLSFDLGIDLGINESNPEAPELLTPGQNEVLNNSTGVFTWSSSISPNAVYDLEIAFDEEFTQVFDTYNSLSASSFIADGLPPSETLYWRVTLVNGCTTVTSATGSFNTAACSFLEPGDLPVPIGAFADTYSSSVEVSLGGEIESVRVFNLSGAHFRVSDLEARLVSPAGTSVVLFSGICGSDDDFNLSFSDDGNPDIDCPPTTGEFYLPSGSLNAFSGEDALGTWTLELEDMESSAGGNWNNWELEICYVENVFGTGDQDAYGAVLFPNPGNGRFIISFGGEALPERVRVLDVAGRLIEEALTVTGSQISIDISREAPGMYFVEVSGKEGRGVYKFIKQN